MRESDQILERLLALHPKIIDLSLIRMHDILVKMGNPHQKLPPVIHVAGTNGKGSTVSYLRSILEEANFSVHVYTSPHLVKFAERIRLNGKIIDEAYLKETLEYCEKINDGEPITYFEITTAAAFKIFAETPADALILEVGLGGRLDATNIIDADIAVITTVDLDHQAFLGDNRESIGFEKAGIMRTEQKVVVGDKQPPLSVLAHAEKLDTKLYLRERDFKVDYCPSENQWSWQCQNLSFTRLKQPCIPLDNIATALMVLTLLQVNLTPQELRGLITSTKVPGRTELVEAHCQVMLDVGHNPLAARYLVEQIELFSATKIHAVVGMLSDKDIFNTLLPLVQTVDCWYLASLDIPRGATAETLKSYLTAETKKTLTFDNVIDAYKMAISHADESDLILVFGSFFTVAQVKAFIN